MDKNSKKIKKDENRKTFVYSGIGLVVLLVFALVNLIFNQAPKANDKLASNSSGQSSVVQESEMPTSEVVSNIVDLEESISSESSDEILKNNIIGNLPTITTGDKIVTILNDRKPDIEVIDDNGSQVAVLRIDGVDMGHVRVVGFAYTFEETENTVTYASVEMRE